MTQLTNTEIAELSFDELLEKIEDALKISTDNYDLESIKFVSIFSLFSRMNRIHVKKLLELSKQRDKVFVQRQKHYSGKMKPEHYQKEELQVIPEKKDIDKWVRADSIVQEIESLVKDQELVVDLIERAMKEATTRNFAVKNCLEYKKLIQG